MRQNKKRNIMGIRRWLKDWLNESNGDILTEKQYALSTVNGRNSPALRGESSERAIRLSIYSASGGRIVETTRYDANKDKHYNNLYIITSEQDLGRELDKILTIESLRG